MKVTPTNATKATTTIATSKVAIGFKFGSECTVFTPVSSALLVANIDCSGLGLFQKALILI